jgi:hypothetical protein
VGDSLKLTDVATPEGLTLTGDLDLVIATVTGSSAVDAPEDEVAELDEEIEEAPEAE